MGTCKVGIDTTVTVYQMSFILHDTMEYECRYSYVTGMPLSNFVYHKIVNPFSAPLKLKLLNDR
jgi:hypothetical protein